MFVIRRSLTGTGRLAPRALTAAAATTTVTRSVRSFSLSPRSRKENAAEKSEEGASGANFSGDQGFGVRSQLSGDAASGQKSSLGFDEPVELKARSLFVSNAPLDAKESDIKEYFSQAAPVDFVIKGPTGLYFWVYFQDAATAETVRAKLDNVFWLGRMLRVKARIIKQRTPNFGSEIHAATPTLFLGNMPFTMTDSDLNNLSKRLEYSFDIRVAVDRASGWPRGYCHADFYTTGLAQRAFHRALLDPIRMGPNQLRVSFAAPAKSKNWDYEASRRKALMYSHRNVEYYEELTEKLRDEEGGWEITAELVSKQPAVQFRQPPSPSVEPIRDESNE